MAEGFFRFFSKDHFPLMISHDVYDQKCKISKRNRNREIETNPLNWKMIPPFFQVIKRQIFAIMII